MKQNFSTHIKSQNKHSISKEASVCPHVDNKRQTLCTRKSEFLTT